MKFISVNSTHVGSCMVLYGYLTKTWGKDHENERKSDADYWEKQSG